MARAEAFHSWLVAWLKILLPLAALGILSTMFLFSRTIDPSRATHLARGDVKKLAQEPRITAPDYAGVTADGTAVLVTAQSAKPGTVGKGAAAHGLRVQMDTPDGAHADITAAEGSVDPANSRLQLSGGVRITDAAGYTVTAVALSGALNRSELHSDGGPVSAVGPLVRLNAGAMSLTQTPADGDSPAMYVLVFKDGVKLIYTPRDSKK